LNKLIRFFIYDLYITDPPTVNKEVRLFVYDSHVTSVANKEVKLQIYDNYITETNPNKEVKLQIYNNYVEDYANKEVKLQIYDHFVDIIPIPDNVIDWADGSLTLFTENADHSLTRTGTINSWSNNKAESILDVKDENWMFETVQTILTARNQMIQWCDSFDGISVHAGDLNVQISKANSGANIFVGIKSGSSTLVWHDTGLVTGDIAIKVIKENTNLRFLVNNVEIRVEPDWISYPKKIRVNTFTESMSPMKFSNEQLPQGGARYLWYIGRGSRFQGRKYGRSLVRRTSI
jgi:hypothetical protein